MRFHGILTIRDEADIIEQTLRHLVTWCDGIYVYDTGSIDGTWDIVREVGRESPQIQPLERAEVLFDDTIRAYVFDQVRHQFDDGDWVLRLDGDEFYHMTPPDFVRNHMEAHETAALNQTYEFRFTEEELEAWRRGNATKADRERPIEQRRTCYESLEWSEPRMFRYRTSMQWPRAVYGPHNAGFVARCRIPIRHYPHRDPEQMRRRSVLRSLTAEYTPHVGAHWEQDWRELVARDKEALQHRTSETEFPVPCDPGHLPNPTKRTVQYLLHRFGVRLADQFRPEFPEDYQPEPLPPSFQEQLEELYDAGVQL